MTVNNTMLPPPAPYARERRIAERAVHRASILTKRAIRLTPSYWTHSSSASPVASTPSSRKLSNGELSKSDASPVTAADFAAQALLISAIRGAFPQDGFVGEEDADSLRRDPLLAMQVFDFVRQYAGVKFVEGDRAGEEEEELYAPKSVEEMFEIIDLGGRGRGGRRGRFWALDPIDGTAAFVKGQQYAVSVALIEHGREVVGVLGCPNLKLSEDGGSGSGRRVEETSVDLEGVGLLLSAVRGQGAWIRPMGWEGSKLRIAQSIEHLLPAEPPSAPSPTTNGNGIAKPKSNSAHNPLLSSLHFIDSSLSSATLSHKVHQLARTCGATHSPDSIPFTELYSSHMRYVAATLGGHAAVQVRFPKQPRQTSAPMYIWDHAGAQLIYTESRGGRGKVTDLYGKEIDFGTGRKLTGNWGVVTADEDVHGEILELVKGMIEL